MPDPRIGIRLRPGAETHFKTSEFESDIAINSQGTRDDEIPPKAPDERRIVVLGDSMVMAVQVSPRETFCRRLQTRLNDVRGPYRYRVINAGVQGYGPVEDLLFYQHVVQQYQPDLVILALYVANDAVEAAGSAARLQPGVPAALHDQLADGTRVWLRRTVRRSMVLQILRQRVLDVVGRFQNSGRMELPPALTMYLPTAPPHIHQGLAVTRDCVTRLADMAGKRGAKVAVALLPARFQVSDESWEGLRAGWAADGVVLVRDAATERFKEALAPLGLPVFDPLPALRAWPKHEDLYFRGAGHLTTTGHRVVGDALERFLRDARLLEPQPDAATAAAAR